MFHSFSLEDNLAHTEMLSQIGCLIKSNQLTFIIVNYNKAWGSGFGLSSQYLIMGNPIVALV